MASKRLVMLILAVLFVFSSIPRYAEHVRGIIVNPVDGHVNGIWRVSDSPVYVQRDIDVLTGESLTIEPGVFVYFAGSFKLWVYGKIVAVGTYGNRITFAYSGGGTGRSDWKGITLFSATNPSTISYCTINNALVALNCSGSTYNTITYNTIRYNTAGILVDTAEGNVIQNNEIYDTTEYGIRLQRGCQKTDISKNTIYKIDGNGIVIAGGSTTQNVNNFIKDNTIYNNHQAGIRVSVLQTLEISGNLIYNNWRNPTTSIGGNILLAYEASSFEYSNKDVTITNNRIHSASNNGTGLYIQHATQVVITYNDIYLNDAVGVVTAGPPVPNAQTTFIRTYRNDIRNNRWAEASDLGSAPGTTTNTWDDGSRGNYWGNYSSVDKDNNGIGDDPFWLYPRWRGIKDGFPLMGPVLFIVSTTTIGTTATGTSTAYKTTVTSTISTWSATTTVIPVTSFSTIATVTTSTTRTITNSTTVTWGWVITTFFATYTSYPWTVSSTSTVMFYSTSSTSTTMTTTVTSTSTSTTSTTVTTTTTATAEHTTTARRCIIASAAYGSDLAPPVQYLRDFRDQETLNTFAGAQFMKAFNAFYYSFSPALAEFISTTSPTLALTRALISPLIVSLQIGQTLAGILMPQSDGKILMAGLISSSLIGLLYASPILAVSAVKTGEERRRRGMSLKYLALIWIGSLFALTLSILMHYSGEVFFSDFIAMVSSGTLVLSTMILSPLLLLKLIQRLIRRNR